MRRRAVMMDESGIGGLGARAAWRIREYRRALVGVILPKVSSLG